MGMTDGVTGDGKPDNRLRKRLTVRFTVSFGVGAPERTAFTGNVSEHGLLLNTNQVYPAGTVLKLKIETPEHLTFPLVGRVIWAKKVPRHLLRVRQSAMGLHIEEPSANWREFCENWDSGG